MLKSNWSRNTPTIDINRDQVQRAASSFLGQRRVEKVTHLSSGLINTIYRIDCEEGLTLCMKIYQRGDRHATLEQAVSEIVTLEAVPRCLYLSRPQSIANLRFALFEWRPGRRLDMVYDELTNDVLIRVIARVSQIIHRVHQVRFDQTGLLASAGKSLKVVETFAPNQLGLQDYAAKVLTSKLAQKRLGPSICRDFGRWCQDVVFPSTTLPASLCHGDFGPENVLYDRESDTLSLIDWEFACAGNALVDLGHWLREPLLPPDQFCKMVDHVFPSLGTNWPIEAQWTDLFAWLEFLTRSDIPEQVVQLARSKILTVLF